MSPTVQLPFSSEEGEPFIPVSPFPFIPPVIPLTKTPESQSVIPLRRIKEEQPQFQALEKICQTRGRGHIFHNNIEQAS